MTVKGRVVSLSHVGGLLAEFEDKAPGLGWEVRIEGGRTIGKVDSVIGGIENALVHVSLSEKIDSSSAIGAPIEIGRRSRNDNKKNRNVSKGGGQRRDRSRSKNMGNEKFGDRKPRKTNSGKILPTWVCSACRSMNSRTSKCSKCGSPRPQKSPGSGATQRNRSDRGKRQGDASGRRPRSSPVRYGNRDNNARNRNDRSRRESHGDKRGRTNRRPR